ncbi:MAG: hypothetical protein BGO87_12890 [Flavobacteriia bacterium 40-80]|uniref:YecA family protein n=1 Tax=uncultured Flavobacterium sp. TaxID=165435 RepID=UPI000959ACB3|nr:SEC-C metal-binding domain-containing protein [uncultured Flavobacterium sp.]OJX36687.1 MAG: hypothetical protein BGO87_12890 [Flavobacteriia bacterium 40-80]
MKIGRNEPCSCGSGKKYKKCCLNKEATESQIDSIDNYNPIELIKVLGLLQLVPENFGKDLRIEVALGHLIAVLKKSTLDTDYGEFNPEEALKMLNAKFPKDYREDPPENSFTDNILFNGQNNTVFAGITEESVLVVQSLLDTIFRFKNQLPEGFKEAVFFGVTFIFDIHQIICDKLGYERHEFRDQVRDELHVNANLGFEHTDLLEFTKKELLEICEKEEIIQEFTLDVKQYKFNKQNINSNQLLFKPFVFIESDQKYILALPSSELTAVNEYILRKAYQYNCLKELVDIYKRTVYSNCLRIFNEQLNYELTDIGLKERDVFSTPYISVLSFDRDKFAIVALVDNMGDGKPENLGRINFPKSEISKVVKQIKSIDSNHKIHLIGLSCKIDSILGSVLSVPELPNINHITILTPLDLNVILTLWKCDHLTLWQYQKAKDRAEEQIFITPNFKNLTYFNWYYRNFESFFHSDENYDAISFSFYDQATLIRLANIKSDTSLAYMYIDNELKGVKVKRNDNVIPSYVLVNNPFPEKQIILLDTYNVPIWIAYSIDYYPLGEGISVALALGITELYSFISEKLNILAPYPLSIELEFDPKFLTNEDPSLQEDKELYYTLNLSTKSVTIFIPLSYGNVIINSENNIADKLLMECILQGMFDLIDNLTGNRFYDKMKLRFLIDSAFSDTDQRMIIPFKNAVPIQMNPTHITRHRHIQESDISFIRENILSWAKIEDLNHIKTKKDKTNLCNQIVTVLIDKFRETAKDFDFLSILRATMISHESLIYYKEYHEESLTPKVRTMGKYTDVVNDFRKENSKNVNGMISYRCMIELLMAEPPKGKNKISTEDIDFLHALTEQIINFGNLSDVIKEEFSDTKIEKLPSGRIGIDHSFFNNELRQFATSYLDNEIADKLHKGTSVYDIDEDAIDKVFKKEWGIGLFEIAEIAYFLSSYSLYKEESSFVMFTEEKFINLFETSPFSKDEIFSFCEHMSLESRGNINQLPKDSKYRQEEIYLWRYNRQLSYIRRPLLKIINKEGVTSYAWSPRHLDMASENLRAIFYHGTLKVDKEHKGIQSLLAAQNHKNGKKFRRTVYEWLIQNTSLHIVPHEVPISPKDALKAETNMGDIDILAVDFDKRAVFLLELKNTKQAKNTYDFKRDIEVYLSKLIPKHIQRSNWISEHKDLLSKLLEKDVSDFKIISNIISSATLPLKYMDNSPIPIYAFSEIKSKGVEILF